MSDESPGMLALQAGVLKQVLPHTIDAREWAKEFNATACKLGYQVMDEGWLVAWFANAIMAGYDTATMRLAADNAALRLKVQEYNSALDAMTARYVVLETLVEALPVVEVDGVIVWAAPDESGWFVSKRPAPTGTYWAKFKTQEDAKSFLALLKSRATLAAQDAGQGGLQ